MFTFNHVGAFGSASDPWAITSVLLPLPFQTQTLMLAGGSAIGTYHLLQDTAQGSTLRATYPLSDPTGGFMLTDAALVSLAGQWQVWSVGRTGTDIQRHQLGADGSLVSLPSLGAASGVRTDVSVIETIHFKDVSYLVTASHDRATIEWIRPSEDGSAVLADRQADTPKSTLDGVSDMISLTIGEQVFLVAASAQESGLTVFQIGADASLSLIDSLTASDGLWVDGIDALSAVEINGTQYVIAGSAASGSLSVIRVNALGVMFVTDQMLDDRTTLFDGVSRIETAVVNGRAFVLAGGGDGGLTLLEMLPDGRLFHHQSLEARDGWSGLASSISGLSMTVMNGDLRIHAAGTGGLSVFDIDLADLGRGLLGGATNTLSGLSGDDLIFGNGGSDTLYGGAGADVFRIGAGFGISGIDDYQPGTDLIDLGDWGRIYESALSNQSRPYGAEISYADQVLRVNSPDGVGIDPAGWTAADFLFT